MVFVCAGVEGNKTDGSSNSKAKYKEGTTSDQVKIVDSSPTVLGNVNFCLVLINAVW